MTREELKSAFELAKYNKNAICVEIKMPGQKTNELIINDYSALDSKLEYYLKAYDENLVHSMNDRIKIVDAYPCEYYAPEFTRAKGRYLALLWKDEKDDSLHCDVMGE